MTRGAPGRPLRVAVVIPAFYPAEAYGGTISTSLETAECLADRGVEVTVSTTNTHRPRPLDVDTRRWHQRAPGYRVRYYKDTVHERLSVAMAANLWRDIKRADVVHSQGFFHSAIPLAMGWARLLGKPVLHTPHGELGAWPLSQGFSPRLKRAWIRGVVGPVAKGVLWHATNPQEADEIRAAFPGARAVVIPNGIDTDAFVDARRPDRAAYAARFLRGHAGQGPVIVALGRLHAKKGLDVLVDAFARVADAHPTAALALAGPDEGAADGLRAQAAALGLSDRLFLVGKLARPETVDFLAGADVFALPSHHENFGLVYAEALAAGTPVVASVNTPWQEVERRRCGRWVEVDAGQVADAIEGLLAADPDAAGARGRAWVMDAFAWPAVTARLEAEMRRLAGWPPAADGAEAAP